MQVSGHDAHSQRSESKDPYSSIRHAKGHGSSMGQANIWNFYLHFLITNYLINSQVNILIIWSVYLVNSRTLDFVLRVQLNFEHPDLLGLTISIVLAMSLEEVHRVSVRPFRVNVHPEINSHCSLHLGIVWENNQKCLWSQRGETMDQLYIVSFEENELAIELKRQSDCPYCCLVFDKFLSKLKYSLIVAAGLRFLSDKF